MEKRAMQNVHRDFVLTLTHFKEVHFVFHTEEALKNDKFDEFSIDYYENPDADEFEEQYKRIIQKLRK